MSKKNVFSCLVLDNGNYCLPCSYMKQETPCINCPSYSMLKYRKLSSQPGIRQPEAPKDAMATKETLVSNDALESKDTLAPNDTKNNRLKDVEEKLGKLPAFDLNETKQRYRPLAPRPTYMPVVAPVVAKLPARPLAIKPPMVLNITKPFTFEPSEAKTVIKTKPSPDAKAGPKVKIYTKKISTKHILAKIKDSRTVYVKPGIDFIVIIRKQEELNKSMATILICKNAEGIYTKTADIFHVVSYETVHAKGIDSYSLLIELSEKRYVYVYEKAYTFVSNDPYNMLKDDLTMKY